MKFKNDLIFLFAWIVSIVATLSSLYLSEVLGFNPCNLCWYQRILMYPLIVLFAFGYWKRDLNIALYAYPLVLAGNLLSFYHYGVQKLGFYFPVHSCSPGAACNGTYIELFGFVTIPFLSFIAFTILNICSLIILSRRKQG